MAAKEMEESDMYQVENAQVKQGARYFKRLKIMISQKKALASSGLYLLFDDGGRLLLLSGNSAIRFAENRQHGGTVFSKYCGEISCTAPYVVERGSLCKN